MPETSAAVPDHVALVEQSLATLDDETITHVAERAVDGVQRVERLSYGALAAIVGGCTVLTPIAGPVAVGLGWVLFLVAALVSGIGSRVALRDILDDVKDLGFDRRAVRAVHRGMMRGLRPFLPRFTREGKIASVEKALRRERERARRRLRG